MPRRVAVIVECDLCPDPEEGTGLIHVLSLGGRSVELDLCEMHEKELTEALAPFFEHGHRPGRLSGLPASKTETGPHRRQNIRFNPKFCPKCGLMASGGTGLSAHQRHCDGTLPPLMCEVPGCKFGFTKPTGLRTHMTVMHAPDGAMTLYLAGQSPLARQAQGEDGDGPEDCAKCGTTFGTGQSLSIHEAACDGNPPRFMCEQPGCNYGFMSHSGRKAHVVKMHSPGPESPEADALGWISCDMKDCKAKFPTNKGMIMHKDRLHQGWRDA